MPMSTWFTTPPVSALGQAVFKKHCELCHQIRGEGKKFGPDLDGIGVRGLDRLLEDLLDPNRNVDPAFHTTTVFTESGQLHSGLALRDEGAIALEQRYQDWPEELVKDEALVAD